MEKKNKKILLIGLNCLDYVVNVKEFPIEDTDKRCDGFLKSRGGNASNNCTVVSLLGGASEFLGVIPNCNEQSFILKDFKKYNIDTRHCKFVDGFKCPSSMVICNSTNGSRTILHHNSGIPEIECSYLKDLDLNFEDYSWIHFEGRTSVNEIFSMIIYCSDVRKNKSLEFGISIELEKPLSKFNSLLKCPIDCFIIGSDFAKHKGFENSSNAVDGLKEDIIPGTYIVCPWGDTGCSAIDNNGALLTKKASSPKQVVDTLGAGDTFIAALILKLSNQYPLDIALDCAIKIAGYKVGIKGFDGLGDLDSDLF